MCTCVCGYERLDVYDEKEKEEEEWFGKKKERERRDEESETYTPPRSDSAPDLTCT